MSMWRFLMVLLCVLLISVGQVLFKYAALKSASRPGLMGLLLNQYLVAAGIIYVVATLLWVWQLKFVALNRAYPIYAAAFILVPLMTWILLRERVGWSYAAGVLFIIIGVALCTRDFS